MAKRYRGPGYQSYYGRRTSKAGDALKWIIVFLLAVLVVVVGLYFMLQNGLIYDADGVHVALPWDRPEESPSPEPPESLSAPPSETPEETPDNTVLVIETPEPEPEPPAPTFRELARETLQAVEVTPTVLLAGRAAQQVERAGGNAALVEMKRDDGTLNYVSSVELAISLKASGSDTMVNQAIRELIDGDYYTIAQVSCFRDHLVGNVESCALLSYSGYRWQDFGGVRWSSAGKTSTQDYIVDLCVELAQMGFDEILLTNCGFPPSGSGEMTWIRQDSTYPLGELETIIGPFLVRVKEALAPYGTALSVKALGIELSGEKYATGLKMENVLENCDHVWMDGEDAAAYEEVLSQSEGFREKLVAIVSEAGEAENPWAISAG